jgi:outer membrane protein OmpA-like peptidoglycan-associated protein
MLCLTIAAPVAFGQAMTMTREDQINLVAPTSSGETGLFTAVTGNQLRAGDWSFGIYLNDYDLFAGPARNFAPLTARKYQDLGYDLYRLNLSLGYGITDRWEVSASLPWDRLQGHGGDRAGFVNGWLYQGRFSDSGVGNLHLATKLGLMAPDAPSKLALSIFADLPTGDKDSGISSGNGNFGAGLHWTKGIATLGGTYVIVGKRDSAHSNVGSTLFNTSSVELPNELRFDGGLNVPLTFWRTTNWINEINATWYNGGDFKPRSPINLVTGLRHWFGDSGWAANAGVRFNAAKFSKDHSECRVTELDDCSLSGLVGLTYSPMHMAAIAPPPPPAPTPVPPPPPPPPAPVAPPEPPPVVPPHVATELRTDEIHFEPGSARLTNIAKAILDDVALRMKQEPTSTAVVIGYNDDREATGANADLDRRRAEAVRDYLVTRHGIDPSRITVEGHDGREPVGDNTTAEGRLRNRRVVIRLIIP